MKHHIKGLFTCLCGFVLLAAQASASSLDELQSLASSSPEDYGKVYDKDLASATAGASTQLTQQQLKQMMLSDLDSVRSMIAARYAPAGWKKEEFGWNLDAEIQKAKDQINASPSFGVKDYQQTLKRLLNSMKDYHVSVSFYSTESSRLPFSVTEAGGRYFISGIDRKALPETVFPFKVGDELASFNGKPVGEAVADVERQAGMNDVPHTDQSISAMLLTYRSGASADTVPQGPVAISVIPAGASAPVPFQLDWVHAPEFIAPQPFVSKTVAGIRIPMSWLGMMMARRRIHRVTIII